MVEIKYVNNHAKIEYELKKMNKIQVTDKNSDEIKQEIIRDYDSQFEMIGKLSVGDQIRETHIIFRKITDYELYINSIDDGYDAEDAIFNFYINKISTPQFNLVNRSQYGNGCSFKHEIIELRGNKCFIPSKRYCFNVLIT